jgi:UPF0755 protein
MARDRLYSSRRPRSGVSASVYNQKTLHRDREYGFYWYSWLWHMLRPVLVFLCSLIVVLGIVASGWRYVYSQFFMPVNPSDSVVREFTIDKGSSITNIGSNLYDQKLIRNKGIFKYIIQFQGLTAKIQYGTYPLSSSMDINQIVSILTSGNTGTSERTITIIPGWTAEDIAAYLVKQGALKDTKDFLSLAGNADLFKNDFREVQDAVDSGTIKDRKYALEGYLAPDTYRIYSDSSAESILRTLLKQTEAVTDGVFNTTPTTETVYDDQGNVIDQVLYESKLTHDQTIILASLIEKEASKKEDYARVSAVFHNRLDHGMRLDSDVTVAYPLGIKRMLLTSQEIASVNGYNTYNKDGLPVGPICSPSKAAITAALYPDMEYIAEGYLYFCAGDPAKGEIVYAKSKEEHQQNVIKYKPLWQTYDDKNAAAAATAAPAA